MYILYLFIWYENVVYVDCTRSGNRVDNDDRYLVRKNKSKIKLKFL
jgi:hypothetical protein